MLDTFFGFSVEYGVGHKTSSVAMNNRLDVFEVHALPDSSYDLYYRYGSWNGPTITWLSPLNYDKGIDPAVAVNGKYVVEVHNSQKSGNTDDLWIHVGAIADPIDFGKGEQYDTGRFAGIALSENNVIVEVHQHPDKDQVYYCYGTTDGKSFTWKQKGIKFADGSRPRVAINSHGLAVMTWERDGDVLSMVCPIGPDSLTVGDIGNHGSGSRPAVAMTEDGLVVHVYEPPPDMFFYAPLRQQLFRASTGGMLEIANPHDFDTGIRASVAASGMVAVHVHQSDDSSSPRLYFSNALIVDGASWMRDRLDLLSEVPLRSLVLPASHDSAMYRSDGVEYFGQTQDLSIASQLNYGIRWFDLRPLYDSGTGTIYMWHGDPSLYVTGPKLADVLDQMKSFLQTHEELVILKFSHFLNFNDTTYAQLAQQIVKALEPWLVEKTPNGKRLADVTLYEYVSGGGAALAVMDQTYFFKNRTPGLWHYRDWDKDDAANGDLRVYDSYADMWTYSNMKADQIGKFDSYDGICKPANVICDLFLLSWTLTPPTAVWLFVGDPNRYLGEVVTTEMKIPNASGKIVNLLYVDYAEYARVTDVALYQAGVEVPAKK